MSINRRKLLVRVRKAELILLITQFYQILDCRFAITFETKNVEY